jgi:hypothetical protein
MVGRTSFGRYARSLGAGGGVVEPLVLLSTVAVAVAMGFSEVLGRKSRNRRTNLEYKEASNEAISVFYQDSQGRDPKQSTPTGRWTGGHEVCILVFMAWNSSRFTREGQHSMLTCIHVTLS